MIGIFNLNLDLLSLESFFEELDTPDLVLVSLSWESCIDIV